MKKITALSIIFIGFIIICSCSLDFNCKKGEGEVKTEQREVGTFKSISLEMGADIELTQSKETSVSVTTNANLMKYIDVRIERDELIVDTKDCNCITTSDDIKLKVSSPFIEEISLAGSGKVRSVGTISTENITCNVNGSGDIILEDLHTDNYSVYINGSGDVELSGSPSKTGEISINGSGDVNTSNVATSAMVVSISGSGDVKIKPTAALDVSIAGSGDVIYYGSPKISRSIAGSGDLVQRD